MLISNQHSVTRKQTTFPVCYKSVPCCRPPPILPPRCNPILCSHAAAKTVKLQHHTNTAGGCRWWSTVSCTIQGSHSKRSVAMNWSSSRQSSLKGAEKSVLADKCIFGSFHNCSYHSFNKQTTVSNYSNTSGSTSSCNNGKLQCKVLRCKQWLLSSRGMDLKGYLYWWWILIICFFLLYFRLILTAAWPFYFKENKQWNKWQSLICQSALLPLKGKLLTLTSCLEYYPCNVRTTNSALRTRTRTFSVSTGTLNQQPSAKYK